MGSSLAESRRNPQLWQTPGNDRPRSGGATGGLSARATPSRADKPPVAPDPTGRFPLTNCLYERGSQHAFLTMLCDLGAIRPHCVVIRLPDLPASPVPMRDTRLREACVERDEEHSEQGPERVALDPPIARVGTQSRRAGTGQPVANTSSSLASSGFIPISIS